LYDYTRYYLGIDRKYHNYLRSHVDMMMKGESQIHTQHEWVSLELEKRLTSEKKDKKRSKGGSSAQVNSADEHSKVKQTKDEVKKETKEEKSEEASDQLKAPPLNDHPIPSYTREVLNFSIVLNFR
jgi:hypothetical protein